ncbi:MAG TPA: DEAD/DEAH box helicase [Candidatus Dormibacteraeota bacterium]|nr:DEAD/DEAH box helicase [Candidatus Dormibacteraeota bacterium]
MAVSRALDLFSAPARAWFTSTFQAPTEVQERGWLAIAAGQHTLLSAPTGSGKTLAAFLWCLDRLLVEPSPPSSPRCRVLYISPLKALAVDVERNLRAPLVGLRLQARRLGLPAPEISVAIRSGDTPAEERRAIVRRPPDVLITTPESLYLLLTSAARRVLAEVRWVIVDEIHAVAASKRGAHLAISLERLGALTATEPQRIGLSATQRPLEEVARFLGGVDRPVEIVEAGHVPKALELRVEVPVEDMADLERGAPEPATGPAAAWAGELPAPRRSIWPAIYPRLLELIEQHRSTIVFVNSRRLAERLAARLNELAGMEVALAHHGSIAREQRLLIEDRLKSGDLRALVATSSLELGIDMGAVDLVVQVEAPPSVAAGIQRVGRAGHSVLDVSRGVILPKFRGDLLKSAAVAERMLAGEIESTVVPSTPLDVLAQQIVAMAALEEWRVEDLSQLLRRAYPYRGLGRRSLEAVLDMLSGRYPSEEFRELRPRLVWDRARGTVRARAGAQRLAVTNPGTIPDRGLYTVNLFEDGRPGRRVGELDEEMVFETRPGETFVLGASTWKVVEITHSQVLVTPAPGEPGKIAFWHGDALSRPVELGRTLGRLTRELGSMPRLEAERRLRERAGFDERAARNLLAYLEDQAAATGAVPDDRTVVVERFRDEVGDWRVCILTPLGGKVHAPWALALQARLAERLGLEVQTMFTDDGLALRLLDSDRPLEVDELLPEPEEVEDLVRAQLPASALFAARFRENAARSLLLPRRRPGQRTPLWQQRQRSAGLLQVAASYPDFPILAETLRECLTDVFDLDALRQLLADVRARRVRVVAVDTEHASPFAASLLFDYVGQYIYEGDAPLAERRAQALTLDRELLAELLGTEELRELLDPEVVAEVELALQGLKPETFPRDADETHDLLARLGDLEEAELRARGVDPGWLTALEAERRACRLRLAGVERWIVAEDAGRYRDALGATPPPGLPATFLEPVEGALESLVRRWARTHVPFVATEVAARWGLPVAVVEAALGKLVASGELVAGTFRRSGAEGREYGHPEVLRTLRRRSLAALRREVEPVAPAALARFLPVWHGIEVTSEAGEPHPSRPATPDRLLECVATLQGLALPASVLERDVLRARVPGYRPALLDELVATGEVVWVGRGPLGPGDGRVSLYLRADAARLVPEPQEGPPGELQARIRDHLARRGASFFPDLYVAAGGGDPEAVLDALWDMVWAGEVTNDTFAPLRLAGGPPRRAVSARRPLRQRVPPRGAGRWSLVRDLLAPRATPTERLYAQAEALLQRHGVLTREAVVAEGWVGGFAALYPVLRAMEEAGRARRGYFVAGLGGSQFALPGAVDRLRACREPDGRVLALAATDPANPYGMTLPWPKHEGGARPARAAGTYLVTESGELRLYLERGGRSLWTWGEVRAEHLRALVAVASGGGRLQVERVDGVAVRSSPLASVLVESGFGSSPKGMVAWPRTA